MKYFCNTRVGELCEIFVQQKFSAVHVQYNYCDKFCISSQCDNKASEDSTPVHVLTLEDGAGTDIRHQHSVSDSAVLMAPGTRVHNMIVCCYH